MLPPRSPCCPRHWKVLPKPLQTHLHMNMEYEDPHLRSIMHCVSSHTNPDSLIPDKSFYDSTSLVRKVLQH